MSNINSKNILLSQPKIGLAVDTPDRTLAHTSINEGTATVVNIEIPGVDPSTVNVDFENNILNVSCEKGSVSIPLPVNTDSSKIQADILWGLLTLRIPHPEEPPMQTIKVSIHDTLRKTAHKATEKKFTDEG
jgi:HSP20 family molecular chaperone IbpA